MSEHIHPGEGEADNEKKEEYFTFCLSTDLGKFELYHNEKINSHESYMRIHKMLVENNKSYNSFLLKFSNKSTALEIKNIIDSYTGKKLKGWIDLIPSIGLRILKINRFSFSNTNTFIIETVKTYKKYSYEAEDIIGFNNGQYLLFLNEKMNIKGVKETLIE